MREVARIMKDTPIQLTKLEPVPNDLTVVNQDGSMETGGWQGDPPRGLYADTTLNKNFSELITRPQNDRGVNNREDFTDPIPMTHNNMVPFFGASSKQNMDMDNRLLDNKLETFTGQFKLDKQHRTEAGPMFAPVQQNLEQLAAPRQLDRFTTNLQIRNNELPFEQIKVGRGLDNGYTAQPTGGFHNTLRILPKNIEQLLVNPRVVAEGRVIRGKDNVDKRTAQQQQFKYRPELLVTNFDGERNFTTTGAYLKPKARSKVVIMPTNRQKSRKIIGTAHQVNGSKSTPNNLRPMEKQSTKVSFKNTPFRNNVKVEGKMGHDNQQLKFENKKNERSVTGVRYGTCGYSTTNRKFNVEQGQSYPTDKAKKTRNQAYVFNKNPVGFTQVTSNPGIAFNHNDQAKTTIRETTENNQFKGQVSQTGQIRQKVYDPNDQARATGRETIEVNTHQGQLQTGAGGVGKGRAYNPDDQTRTTQRETTENNTHQGQLQAGNGGLGKGRAYNPDDQTRTTHRETTEVNTHQGQLQTGAGGVGKGRAYNPDDQTRTTHRETTEANTQQGQMQSGAGGGLGKGRAYDPFDQTRTTIRETTEVNTHQGQLQSGAGGGLGKGRTYNPDDQTRTTIRETTEANTYQGQLQSGAGGGLGKGRAYNPDDQTRTTIRETTEANTHQGQLQSGAGGGLGKGRAYNPDDQTRTTIRETTEANTHQGQLQSGAGGGLGKGRAYNPDDQTRTTIRETTEANTYQGQMQSGAGGGLGKGRAYNPDDQTRTTIRETTEANTHQGQMQAGASGGLGKGRVYNPDDQTRTTIRETTENQTTQGHVQAGAGGGLGKGRVYNPDDQTRTTIRETTENQTHQGHAQAAGARGVKGKVYNANDQAKTTIRETTEDLDYMGVVSHPQGTKQRVYDPEDIAKTTIKETTEQSDYMGTVSHPQRTKQKVYDPNDIAKTTIKETTEQSDYMGTVSHPQGTKQKVYDPFDFMRTTHRETTENNDHLNPVQATYLQSGLGYQTAPLDVKNTSRQFLTDYYYVKPGAQADAPANPQSYDSVYNMRQNYNKEEVAEGRYPTLSNVKLCGNMKENTFIEIKKLDQDRLNQYGAVPSPTCPNSRKPMDECELTSFKNNLPPFNSYFDPKLLKAYNQNPLTQSLHSWA
jgi:hypothetical protein